MNADRKFWLLFGGVCLLVGLAFLLGGLALLASDGTGEATIMLLAFVGVGAVLAGVGAVIVRHALRQAARARQLRATGIPVNATVVAVREGSLSVNDEPYWIVRYRYRYSGGDEHSGESPSLPAEVAQQWRPGDSAAIVVDPRDPATSLWLGTR